jgi:8-oxo-dGTP diphosphatase
MTQDSLQQQVHVLRVGCGAFILNDRQELLLIERLTDPEAGCWSLPGGKVDLYERAEDAVRREIAEELGVEIRLGRLLCVAELIDSNTGVHFVNPIYLALITAGQPVIMEPEKMSGLGWFAFAKMPDRLTVSTQAAVTAYLHADSNGGAAVGVP